MKSFLGSFLGAILLTGFIPSAVRADVMATAVPKMDGYSIALCGDHDFLVLQNNGHDRRGWQEDASSIATCFGIHTTYLGKFEHQGYSDDGLIKDPSVFTVGGIDGTFGYFVFRGYPGISLDYFVVKAGNEWGLFDVRDIPVGTAITWPPINEHATSHISFYGSAIAQVPEPTTLVLVGLGLLGTGLMAARRRR